jgi:hypothetical protein
MLATIEEHCFHHVVDLVRHFRTTQQDYFRIARQPEAIQTLCIQCSQRLFLVNAMMLFSVAKGPTISRPRWVGVLVALATVRESLCLEGVV